MRCADSDGSRQRNWPRSPYPPRIRRPPSQRKGAHEKKRRTPPPPEKQSVGDDPIALDIEVEVEGFDIDSADAPCTVVEDGFDCDVDGTPTPVSVELGGTGPLPWADGDCVLVKVSKGSTTIMNIVEVEDPQGRLLGLLIGGFRVSSGPSAQDEASRTRAKEQGLAYPFSTNRVVTRTAAGATPGRVGRRRHRGRAEA